MNPYKDMQRKTYLPTNMGRRTVKICWYWHTQNIRHVVRMRLLEK